MARPKKLTVEYFPHMCVSGKTLFILEQEYKNDGYAFWFKLLEELGKNAGHFINYNDEAFQMFFAAKTGVNVTKTHEILHLLAKLGAIDKTLWENGIIWSENFVHNIYEIAGFRRKERPKKPSFGNNNATKDELLQQKLSENVVSAESMPQRKENKNKVNKIEEKKVFPKHPLPTDMNGLPEIKIGSAIELIWHTKNLKINNEKVLGLWDVFKNQNLTGKKHYESEEDVQSHFINWIKKQDFEKIKSISSSQNGNPVEDEARKILKQNQR